MMSRKWLILAIVVLVLAFAIPAFASDSDSESENSVTLDRRHHSRGVQRAASRLAAKRAAPARANQRKAAAGKTAAKATRATKATRAKSTKAAKATKQAARAGKKASALKKVAGKAAKLAKKASRAAKKAGRAAKKAAAAAKKKINAAVNAIAKKAAARAKKLGLSPAQTKRFVAAQKRKARSRLNPKDASKLKDKQLRRLAKHVKKARSRAAITKLQAALKKKRAGSVKLGIKHHKITIHPRSPRAKKVKVHKESPTDHNYVKHLKATRLHLKKKIDNLQSEINFATAQKPARNDWPIEYSTLDPPDSSKAAAAAELYTELKPFLKDARSIKQADLEDGREQLVTMENLRWVVHDKLEKAKSQPLLPEMYRFIE